MPAGADHQDRGRQRPLPHSWTRLLGRDQVDGCSSHRLSSQAGSGEGTKVERRREGLQYLALIQVPLNMALAHSDLMTNNTL